MKLLSGIAAVLLAAGIASASEPAGSEARRSGEEAARLEEAASWADAARWRHREAELLLSLGHRARANAAWRLAAESARKANDQAVLALALSGMAMSSPSDVPPLLRRVNESEALALARASGDSRALAAVLVNQGASRARAREYDAAAEAFREALELIPASDAQVRIRLEANLTRLAADRGAPRETAERLARIVTLAPGVPDDGTAAQALLTGLTALLAAAPSLESETQQALAREAARLAAERGAQQSRLAGLAAGLQGRIDAAAGRDAEALSNLRRASRAALQVDAPELLYRWQWDIGRILARTGEGEQALAAYRAAVAALQSVRRDLGTDLQAANVTFRSVYAPMYYELADLVLRQASLQLDASRRRPLLEEARATIELTKAAELEDYFQDGCVAAQQARVRRVEHVAGDVAFVYPVVLRDRLELLVSHAGGIEQFTVPVPEAELVAEIRRFRQRLERRMTRQYLPHAQNLYRWVFQPLEGALARIGARTIVTVPEGALRTIPFAALHDGQDFLVRRFSFATTPGVDLTDPRPLARIGMRVLLSGITEGVQGFVPLPNVGPELEAVGKLFPSRSLLNREYSAAAVEKEIGGAAYGVVHIASHAQFDSDPQRTFLLTYDDKLTMDRLERLIAPSRYRDQPIELLTLSACQTAAGDDRAALGLAGVAIKAGARSALASMWFINDESSAALLSQFYARLREEGTTKSQALQQAQLRLLADNRFNHPAYWSAFLLIGNWL